MNASLLVNTNDQTLLLTDESTSANLLLPALNSTTEIVEETNTERVLAASRRIYIFDWIYDFFISDSIRKANFFALSFVGSGFKTLFLMLLLVFWNITWMVISGLFHFCANLFQ